MALAERLAGEIVSCDSVAVYREFEIGTAKPSPEERARVPHHLIDVVSPLEVFTAGDYSRLARAAIHEIHSAGHLFAGPQRSEELRQRLRARASDRGPQYLHKVLARLDATAAAAIHPNDLPKLVRAVEVCLSARSSMTDMWKQGRDALTGFRVLRIGLQPEREALYQRINARARRMFDRGLVGETRDLMQRYPAARPLESLGYKQAIQYLRGELTLEQAIALAQQGHRNFAKRQLTWFRREPDVHWLSGFGDDALIQERCLELVRVELLATGC